MPGDLIAFRVAPAQKRAIRVLAGEQGMNMTNYLLYVLKEHTPFDEVAQNLEKSVHNREHNVTHRVRK